MKKSEYSLEMKWFRSFEDPVYATMIANLIENQPAQVIGCSYSNKIRGFSLLGKEMFKFDFLPDISQFKANQLSPEQGVCLISGDNYGYVRVQNLKGKKIWKRNLGSPIISMDVEDKIEEIHKSVFIALENNNIAILDYQGEVQFIFESDQPILDVCFGDLTDKSQQDIIVLLKNGDVAKITKDNRMDVLFHLSGKPQKLTFFRVSDIKGFFIGDKYGKIQYISVKGEKICEFSCPDKISDIDHYVEQNTSEFTVFVTAASNNNLYLLNLSIPSSKYLSISKEIISSSPIKQKKAGFVSFQNKVLNCPFCDTILPSSFKKKLIAGSFVYCESCGSQLTKQDFS